ncbi:coiled-coil domain-containing protein 107 [Triplophysa rosa]|uniref:Coiled-coil domain-containing protein 107 n=1 Tax=Triplophysa rosa TaxID=992332 RepID=A0A9W7T9G1_TRIRA|nr:coiled-coil domain-containing protein 107 [Triplophysa rosa]KAI7792084.1 putative coiled-coil domain-containing protein 107 [Triplophysa rosa]
MVARGDLFLSMLTEEDTLSTVLQSSGGVCNEDVMVQISSSQQVVMAFTAVLLVFVLFPRMFSGGGGRESPSFDPRMSRRGPGPGLGPGAVKNPPQFHTNGPSAKSQSVENVHQMKKLMEQEMKSDKSNSNKGYIFTLMPIYAISVGLFAAYKFLKIKSANDSEAQKAKTAQGVKKSEETENQLNELEQRLAQTEKMLNSILTQLDPLTNCVKSVAMEQKSEIMSQLQCIRQLMKKRGMEFPNIRIEELACQRNLDDLIDPLADAETAEESETHAETESHDPRSLPPDPEVQKSIEEEEEEEEQGEHEMEEEVADAGHESVSSMPSLEDSGEITVDDVTIVQKVPDDLTGGLRRRYKPE